MPSPVGSECWRNPNACDDFLQMESMLSEGASLIDVLKTLYPCIEEPPEGWSDHLSLPILEIMSILTKIVDRPPRREKLTAYNTFEDAVELFRTRKRILMLTGAGASVSCGTRFSQQRWNYTQNIDTLGKQAHIERVVGCHETLRQFDKNENFQTYLLLTYHLSDSLCRGRW
ncbi:unnamed protein product [Cylicocyclus nassatus]|uniref:Deacetylase sirtuin-type domain-containing protein n=1 Tax=Cylicocyclus nassatus TaxID=53992 RepID=A0AA36M8Q4_CYLNA|nr:unnamed protein product [Cylicocyclus nassatus]